MTKYLFAAAMIAASVSPLAAIPASAQTMGHYEWQTVQQAGPRAPVHAPVRVWAGSEHMASMAKGRDCLMPADCMSSSGQSANPQG